VVTCQEAGVRAGSGSVGGVDLPDSDAPKLLALLCQIRALTQGF